MFVPRGRGGLGGARRHPGRKVSSCQLVKITLAYAMGCLVTLYVLKVVYSLTGEQALARVFDDSSGRDEHVSSYPYVRVRDFDIYEGSPMTFDDLEMNPPVTKNDVLINATYMCPVYSGPGFDETKVAFTKNVRVASVKTSDTTTTTSRNRAHFLAMPKPQRVALDWDDSPYAAASLTNANYLLSLEPDRFLATFKQNAKMHPKAAPYGGWEHPTCELRGHFLGHYLSALSQLAAYGTAPKQQGEEARRLAIYIVQQLSEVQEALGEDGYLSAFPSEFLDRFDNHKPVWAPLYTIHKLLRGLLDASHLLGIEQALDVAVALAEYIKARVDRVIQERGFDWHTASLNMEYGGINEVAYRLAARVTRNATRRRALADLGQLFEKPCFTGRLLADAVGVANEGPNGKDGLGGYHANTHYPILHGSQTLAEFYSELADSPSPAIHARAQAVLMELSAHFIHVLKQRSYVTGGSTHVEIWAHSHHLGETVADHLAHEPQWANAHQESCTSVNLIATARALLRWRGATAASVSYAELIEKLLLNGILGTQRGLEEGKMLYMTGLGPGASKGGPQHWRPTGWGDAHDSFWCCYGTLVEAFASLPVDVFLSDEDKSSVPEVLVLQLISATLTMDSGTRVKVEAVAPGQNGRSASIVVRTLPRSEELMMLSVRMPSWARASMPISVHLREMNNRVHAIPDVTPGRFLRLRRRWKRGDELRIDIDVELRVECLADARAEFQNLCAVLLGPVVLAALTNGYREVASISADDVQKFVKEVPIASREAVVSLRASSSEGDIYYVVRGDESSDAEWPSSVPPTAIRVSSVESNLPKLLGARKGGTDAANRASWVRHDDAQQMSLESLDRPGCYLGCDGLVCGLPDAGAAPQFRTVEHGSCTTLQSSTGRGVLHVTWTDSSSSSSSSSSPAVTCIGVSEALPPPSSSACLSLDAPSSFPTSSFVYSPPSIISNIRRPTRSYLLVALNGIVDERYSVYLKQRSWTSEVQESWSTN
ncbi:beta-L-arabinofuranosidase [Pseudoscourfieldia marina]